MVISREALLREAMYIDPAFLEARPLCAALHKGWVSKMLSPYQQAGGWGAHYPHYAYLFVGAVLTEDFCFEADAKNEDLLTEDWGRFVQALRVATNFFVWLGTQSGENLLIASHRDMRQETEANRFAYSLFGYMLKCCSRTDGCLSLCDPSISLTGPIVRATRDQMDVCEQVIYLLEHRVVDGWEGWQIYKRAYKKVNPGKNLPF